MNPSLVELRSGRIHVGDRFSVSLQRTLRIPDDGRRYPLPPGLGAFAVRAASEHADRLPESWRGPASFLVPIYHREALWIGFDAAPWKPSAVKIGLGQVNAVSGGPWSDSLHVEPQDYVVCPPQVWIDGINAGEGYVRQFVATPLGLGRSVESQVTGTESDVSIRVLVYDPKPGRFPDTAPPPSAMPLRARQFAGGMGLGAGGTMTQKIYADPHGIETWDPAPVGAVAIHLVTVEEYERITGEPPPPTPVDARAYTAHGLPWFELYDADRAHVSASPVLEQVKTVDEIARGHDASVPPDEPLDVDARQITKIPRPPE